MIPDLCDVTGLKWATASMLPSAAGNIRQNMENMIRKNAALKTVLSISGEPNSSIQSCDFQKQVFLLLKKRNQDCLNPYFTIFSS